MHGLQSKHFYLIYCVLVTLHLLYLLIIAEKTCDT